MATRRNLDPFQNQVKHSICVRETVIDEYNDVVKNYFMAVAAVKEQSANGE